MSKIENKGESDLNENLLSENKEQVDEEEIKKKLIEEEYIKQLSYKDIDGYDRANWISKLFFYWAFRIIRLCNLTKIQVEHFGKPEGPNKSENYLKEIKYTWNEKRYKELKSRALFWAVLRTNCLEIFFMIFFSVFIVGLEYLSINIFRMYILSFSEDISKRPKFESWHIALAFFGLNLFMELFKRLSSQFSNIVGFRTGFELNCMIYEKILRVASSTRNDKTSEGEIINLMQVDSLKLNNSLQMSPYLFTSPIQLGVYTYLLFTYFNFSAFFGLGVLVLFLIINYFMYKFYQKFFRLNLVNKDKRMSATSETINNLKLLKLYAWEQGYLEKIREHRNVELGLIKKVFYVTVWNIGSSFLSPMLVSFATFAGYQYFQSEMKIEDIMSGLYVFGIIGSAVRTLPLSFNSIVETLVSTDRIEKFLRQDEYDYQSIIRINNDLINKLKNNQIDNLDSQLNKKTEFTSRTFDYSENDINSIIENKDYLKHHNNFDKLDEYAIIIKNLSFSWGLDKDGNDNNDKNEKNKSKESDKEQNKTNTESENIKKEDIINNTSNELEELDRNDVTRTEISQSFISKYEKSSTISDKICISYPKEEGIATTLKNISLNIVKGEFIGIIGEVGSGKTSLMEAFLNNLIILNHSDKINESFKSSEKIIINGQISYVPQIPWINNDTLKNNILFNKEFNENLYKKVIDLCELEADINSLIGGDLTEIGEKGINLSGGQKARVSLARSIYSENDIYLFDDPISALDAHVGHNIMTNLIMKELKNKTRILVTHALQYIHNCDRIILMKGGSIEWIGSPKDLCNQPFYTDLCMKLEKKDSSPEVKDNEKNDNENKKENLIEDVKDEEEKKEKEKKKEIMRITSDEDREVGNVSLKIYHKYIQYMGGFFYFFLVMLVMFIWQALKALSDFWIVYWQKNNTKETQWRNLYIYGGLGVGSSIFIFLRVLILILCNLRLSHKVHDEMITSIVNAPINIFHDTIPKGRIMNRFSKDIGMLDIFTMFVSGGLIWQFYSFIGVIVVCSYYTIYSLAFLPILFIPAYFFSSFTNNSNRDLTRVESITRSPIVNLISETIPGSVVIRAYRNESVYMKKFLERIDNNYMLNMFRAGCSNWYSLVMAMTSLLFLGFLLFWTCFFKENYAEGAISIMLTYSMSLQQTLFELLNYFRLFESAMVSMERCLAFTNIQSEKYLELPSDKELSTNDECNKWPSQGVIEFKNYTVKYRPDTEIVLKNLSFKIESNERIGVVGRTGSGKSTLCLSLFRILEPTEGTIFIDGIDICNIGLTKLRSSLTIIPQDPSLMKGTLRYNIDPLSLYNDEQITNSMSKVGLTYILENNKDGLDQAISESGNNLSVGEKQLICICRALLRVRLFFNL